MKTADEIAWETVNNLPKLAPHPTIPLFELRACAEETIRQAILQVRYDVLEEAAQYFEKWEQANRVVGIIDTRQVHTSGTLIEVVKKLRAMAQSEQE